MRIVFAILGMLNVLAGCLGILSSLLWHDNLWMCRLAGSAFIVSGIILIVAAAKKYRGHWAFVVGLTLLSNAFGLLGSELDDVLSGQPVRVDVLVLMFLGCFILGVLSLLSAQRLHQCSEEI
jgi:hypothetical protein